MEKSMSNACKRAVSWVAGVCAAALLVGCSSDGSERFFIVQNQVPQDGCVISGDHTALYRGRGILDVALVFDGALVGYELFPLLQSDLPVMGQTSGTEPNRMALREFRVRLETAPGAPAAVVDLFASAALQPNLAYSEPWSGTLEPGGGTVSAAVTVVPAEVARQIRATGVLTTISDVGLTARVRAVGDSLTDSFESREFVYPIDVCNGCLISNISACPSAPVNKGNACIVSQDEPVDCCSDGASLVCPSRAPASN
jgi:hypothetical protein